MKSMLLLLGICPLVWTSSEPQREAHLFNLADGNGDGYLTHYELHRIFLAFDRNGNLRVTEDEFLRVWQEVYHLGNKQEAEALFSMADSDSDGAVTVVDVPAIFNYFDVDGDYRVNLNEFLTLWGDLRLNAPDSVNIHVDDIDY
ncbi:hypothetical protein ACOMHN_030184 [Nucella lapillus]